ncbi:WD repeat-containing protein WRAP73 [Trichonephila clavipes]|nr:WD repeat-containing protein WRAP73 [Trichonephila clavipes]
MQCLPGATFQQDNVRPHMTRVSQDCLRTVTTHPWSARSPDMSPIEHIWDNLGRIITFIGRCDVISPEALKNHFKPKVIFYSIDGRILGKYVKLATFGFTFFSWNTRGNLIALGDYFGEVTVLDGFNYRKMTSYQELENIESQNLVIYKVKQHTSRDGSPNWELCMFYFNLS